MLGGSDQDEDRQSGADARRIEQRYALLDDAGVVHALDSVPAGIRGEVHLLGNGGHRLRGIFLQKMQNAQIRHIEIGHGKFSHKQRFA